MKRKLSSFSRLLTPILFVGILLTAGLVSFYSVKFYNREQENIENYTHSRMKSLILDLETRVMSVESAMATYSHTHRASIEDSLLIYDRLEQMINDVGFIGAAGMDIWPDDLPDSYSYTFYVKKNADGGFSREMVTTRNSDVSGEEMAYYVKATETLTPVWTRPYWDDILANDCVVCCYEKVEEYNAMLCADIEMKSLMQAIDSLQFYEDSKFYIDVPGVCTFTMENGDLVRVEDLVVDEKDHTKISAHYRHLDLDIINVVPNDRIYSSLWRNLSVILLAVFVGLVFLSVLVHRAFQNAQRRLLHSIQESNAAQEAQRKLQNELSIASRIQMKMLSDPNKAARFAPEGCAAADVMARIIPMREVGGDLYEYRMEGDKLFFCVGDVSGKGIPASVVMTKCSTLFRAYVSYVDNPGPSALLSFLNSQLCMNNDELMFVTMWAGALDLRTGVMEYASAGHNPPVVIHDGHSSFLEMSQGVPLGMYEDSVYPLLNCKFSPSDALLLYTDGITEAENAESKLFGDERLLAVCERCNSSCPEVLCHSVLAAVRQHADGCEQSDDITLLGVSYSNPSTAVRSIEDIPAIHAFVEECGGSQDAAFVLEEAAVNTLTHGKANFVYVEYRNGAYVMTSDGDDFDQTKYEAPVQDELSVGGRGIMLMRQMCSEIHYRRLEYGLSETEFKIKG